MNQVPIEVTSRHGHVSQRMEEYAMRKAERLLRFHDRMSRMELVIDGPHEAPEVELIVHLEHAGTLIAKDRDEHFNSVIDRIMDKMERQLVKAKEKYTQKIHRHESIRDMPPADPDVDRGDSDESFDDAMRKKLDS